MRFFYGLGNIIKQQKNKFEDIWNMSRKINRYKEKSKVNLYESNNSEINYYNFEEENEIDKIEYM